MTEHESVGLEESSFCVILLEKQQTFSHSRLSDAKGSVSVVLLDLSSMIAGLFLPFDID